MIAAGEDSSLICERRRSSIGVVIAEHLASDVNGTLVFSFQNQGENTVGLVTSVIGKQLVSLKEKVDCRPLISRFQMREPQVALQPSSNPGCTNGGIGFELLQQSTSGGGPTRVQEITDMIKLLVEESI